MNLWAFEHYFHQVRKKCSTAQRFIRIEVTSYKIHTLSFYCWASYNKFKILQLFKSTKFFILDSDCGRGFVRFDDVCLNISYTSVPKSDIQAKCSEIGASPLITKSSSLYFQMKNHFIHKGIRFSSGFVSSIFWIVHLLDNSHFELHCKYIQCNLYTFYGCPTFNCNHTILFTFDYCIKYRGKM